MNLQIQQIRFQSKLIKLSPAWVNLFEFVQANPFVKFENLKFANGEPILGAEEVKIVKSHRF